MDFISSSCNSPSEVSGYNTLRRLLEFTVYIRHVQIQRHGVSYGFCFLLQDERPVDLEGDAATRESRSGVDVLLVDGRISVVSRSYRGFPGSRPGEAVRAPLATYTRDNGQFRGTQNSTAYCQCHQVYCIPNWCYMYWNLGNRKRLRYG